MDVIGIVCEYNPFHNGHIYHIEKIKELFPNSIIIAVMSGNFVQRGDTSIVNKWIKTEMALKNGVDLVIELPVQYSLSSAENFGIKIVENLVMRGACIVMHSPKPWNDGKTESIPPPRMSSSLHASISHACSATKFILSSHKQMVFGSPVVEPLCSNVDVL